ncbi:glycine cleavage T C-terminal barrel domain-containing protein [Shewanella marina]|uniref:glycine cleavage T C-terminal barrel domain-containing protein n=1 Tax=Shewanella marina TaxID=487319 RepID=UPI000ABCAB1D|nr:glycine cleavage T C-terminal barrel domain-containing protein [Shewanella marina]
MVEYNALVNHVTMWNVAVERQIQVKGPDAEKLVDYVITRDASLIKPMHGKYVILCNEDGGILNDPVLLRPAEDEFWFSISDSDIEWWIRGVNIGKKFDVTIAEIDVAPVQIQGPKSEALMRDLFGEEVSHIPYYGLMNAQLDGADVLISQTGFTGEKGYEIYCKDATLNAEKVWYGVLEAGKAHNLMVIAPAHHRRIAAGILSWGQDIDQEVSPFQCNLAYQVPRNKQGDYIGKTALEDARAKIDANNSPYKLGMVGLVFGGEQITDYANDFWLVHSSDGNNALGYITSPWYSPELQTNIALAHVPWDMRSVGTKFKISLPEEYGGQMVDAEVVSVPFRPSVNPNSREVAKSKGSDYVA